MNKITTVVLTNTASFVKTKYMKYPKNVAVVLLIKLIFSNEGVPGVIVIRMTIIVYITPTGCRS